MSDDVAIHGRADERFSKVTDVFVENFRERGEIGASLAVYLEGKLVIDLWGGYADQAHSRSWGRDTIVCVMSTTKGAEAKALKTGNPSRHCRSKQRTPALRRKLLSPATANPNGCCCCVSPLMIRKTYRVSLYKGRPCLPGAASPRPRS